MDISEVIRLLERRVTRLEQLLAAATRVEAPPLPASAQMSPLFSASDARLEIVGAYDVERDRDGRPFRWLSSETTIHFALLRTEPAHTTLRLTMSNPHDADIAALTATADNKPVPCRRDTDAVGRVRLLLPLPDPLAGAVNLTLSNMPTVSPAQAGRGGDTRSLSFMLYSIETLV